jgi:2-polyprenyl-6-methoxyphenol hydroxylase-like FAD-dependent oxidoreductase
LMNVPKWFNDEKTIVLMGDAVHAPSPTSGQGGSMALEDGIVLAKALHETNSIGAALEVYETFRRDRVEKIVANGARMSNNKMPGRFGRFMRDLFMPLVAKCVDMEELNHWVCAYRVVWDLPLTQQPPAPTTSMRKVFFGGGAGSKKKHQSSP